jgi:ubiquinone/menaquinone biosynthesis C-methylase UbiE
MSSSEKIKVPVDQAYDSEPWWYDGRGFLILTFAYRSTLPRQIRLFGHNMGSHHLEAAIGSGTLFELILKWRKWKGLAEPSIVGFDYAPRMLEGARRRFQGDSKIQLVQADAAHLIFEDDQFDTLNIANAIHCLPEVYQSFMEFHRVLKPGGTLAGNCLLYPRGSGFMDRLSTWINNWGIKKGILNRPYTALEIKKLLAQTGFEIVSESVTGNCFDFVARKARKL